MSRLRRVGIVEGRKDYCFCGYTEAVAGYKRVKEGLALVWAARSPCGATWVPGSGKRAEIPGEASFTGLRRLAGPRDDTGGLI